jgi:hypothetical protein
MSNDIAMFLPKNNYHMGRDLYTDEMVEWAQEYDKDKPMLGSHRYQKLSVIRGGALVEFVKELGPSSQFPGARPVNGYFGSVYSAGEVMDICERLREGKPEEEEPKDLMTLHLMALEEKQAARAHRSVSGPAITISRN